MKSQKTILRDFELLTEIGCYLSQHFGGIFTEDQKLTKSTHILAKAIDNCFSILSLIPDSKFCSRKDDYIDISSIFSLCRNLIELSNVAWYLIEDHIKEEELKLRLTIFIFHDFVSTKEVFEQLLYNESTNDYLKEKIIEYKTILEHDANFKLLESGTKKLILKGKKSMLLSHFEIAKKRNIDTNEFKAYYQLLSLYTHSTPSSITHLVYSRTEDQENKFNNLILPFNLYYTSSFLAMLIKSVGDLWEMKFAKPKSKKIIEEYSQNLINSR